MLSGASASSSALESAVSHRSPVFHADQYSAKEPWVGFNTLLCHLIAVLPIQVIQPDGKHTLKATGTGTIAVLPLGSAIRPVGFKVQSTHTVRILGHSLDHGHNVFLTVQLFLPPETPGLHHCATKHCHI